MNKSAQSRRAPAAACGTIAGILALLAAASPATAQTASAGPPLSALQRMVARQGGVVAPTRLAVLASEPVASLGFPNRATALRDAPDVFGSVALPIRRTPLDARWRHASRGLAKGLGQAADRLVAGLRGAPAATQAAMVNAWVNARVAFTSDRRDDWSPAAETLRKGRGDCEDYAIAKMQLLRSLRVPSSDMYLVVAYDLVRRQDHAVLVVRAGNAMLLLDSGSDGVRDATARSDYRPIMSFSDGRAWIHGYAAGAPPIRYAGAASPPARLS